MKYLPVSALGLMIVTVGAARATAQTTNPSQAPPDPQSTGIVSVDLSGDRLAELAQWTKEYNAWKEWADQWRNRREPGLLRSVRKRRQPPIPPEWLPDACRLVGDEAGALAEGCKAWRDWSTDDYAAELIAHQIAQTRADKEAPRKTVWWEHIHIDALWPMTQTGSSAYGVAGIHTTLQVTRRFQIFLAPGAMMMRLPSVDGGQRWSPATHWGFSYQLFDFRFPGTSRPSTLHLNLARVWIMGESRLPTTGEMYLAGFSLTFKRSGEPGQDHHSDSTAAPPHDDVRNGTPQ